MIFLSVLQQGKQFRDCLCSSLKSFQGGFYMYSLKKKFVIEEQILFEILSQRAVRPKQPTNQPTSDQSTTADF